LTEGVDVPNIDCIVFTDPRKSKVDIVQALGRALRKKDGKDWGYVILPVIYDEKTNEIDNDSFNEILSIIRGLASNDERIIEYFKDKNQPNSSNKIEGSDIFQIDSELLDEKDLIQSLEIKLWEKLSRFEFVSYESSKTIIRSLGINSQSQFRKNYKKKISSFNIPSNPNRYYKKKGWTNWGDWFGNGYVRDKEYMSFEEAIYFMRKNKITSQTKFRDFFRKNKRPENFPSSPDKVYSKMGKWISWGHFTGSNYTHKRTFLKFEKAKRFVLEHYGYKLNSKTDWITFCNSGERPDFLPSNPHYEYKKTNEWKGWGDFLGTGVVQPQKIEFLTFDEVKKYVKSIGIKNGAEWRKHCKSGLRPKNVPSNIDKKFPNEWKGWGDFLAND